MKDNIKYYKFACGCIIGEQKVENKYRLHCTSGCSLHPYETHRDITTSSSISSRSYSCKTRREMKDNSEIYYKFPCGCIARLETIEGSSLYFYHPILKVCELEWQENSKSSPEALQLVRVTKAEVAIKKLGLGL
jgi:hypothetical protein